MGSSTSLAAVCATRSRMVGIPSARSPPPSRFGIITRRTGSGRYIFETRSSGEPIGVQQGVLPADFVVEHIEAESGFRLRLAIELSLKAPDLFRCFEAHRQSP